MGAHQGDQFDQDPMKTPFRSDPKFQLGYRRSIDGLYLAAMQTG
jgi:hypothetical protein